MNVPPQSCPRRIYALAQNERASALVLACFDVVRSGPFRTGAERGPDAPTAGCFRCRHKSGARARADRTGSCHRARGFDGQGTAGAAARRRRVEHPVARPDRTGARDQSLRHPDPVAGSVDLQQHERGPSGDRREPVRHHPRAGFELQLILPERRTDRAGRSDHPCDLVRHAGAIRHHASQCKQDHVGGHGWRRHRRRNRHPHADGLRFRRLVHQGHHRGPDQRQGGRYRDVRPRRQRRSRVGPQVRQGRSVRHLRRRLRHGKERRRRRGLA